MKELLSTWTYFTHLRELHEIPAFNWFLFYDADLLRCSRLHLKLSYGDSSSIAMATTVKGTQEPLP